MDTSKINNYQGASYNGSEFTAPDKDDIDGMGLDTSKINEGRSKFLSKRQGALADYYTNIIAGVEPDQRLLTRYQEKEFRKSKQAFSYRNRKS